MIIIINITNTHLIFQSKSSVCPLSNLFLPPKHGDLGASLLLLFPLLVNLRVWSYKMSSSCRCSFTSYHTWSQQMGEVILHEQSTRDWSIDDRNRNFRGISVSQPKSHQRSRCQLRAFVRKWYENLVPVLSYSSLFRSFRMPPPKKGFSKRFDALGGSRIFFSSANNMGFENNFINF